jgi:hypothetical protein
MTIEYCSTQHRCNFEGELTTSEFEDLRNNATLHTLQTDKPIAPSNWKRLEAEFFSIRKDVSFRVYGFYGEECHISNIALIPSLKHFYADCLRSCEGLEALKDLKNLSTLSLGIENLTSFDFLKDINSGLKILSLGKTKSSKPDISVIERFSELTDLTVCGHKKGFSSISKLSNLTDLCLYGCTKPDLSWFGALDNLSNLDISLGGADELHDIALAKNLKYLGLCWVRGLENLEFISEIPNLQRLILDRLKQVKQIPELKKVKKLRWLTISDLKSLENLDPIGESNSIEMLSGSCGNLKPSDFISAFKSNSLKYASIYFPSEKKEREFNEIARKNNIATSTENWEFQYV